MVVLMYSIAARLAIIHPEKLKRIIVVGDLHGDIFSFNQIEKFFENEDLLIFLGDYGDRGSNSVEVIEGIQRLLQEYSDRVIAIKGNHEDYSENGEPRFYPCTLIEEAKIKRGSWVLYFQELKKNFLKKLFFAAIIPNLVAFIHGGISTKIRSIDDLINPSKEIEEDVIWSDPSTRSRGEYPNPRGAGVLFGPNISDVVTRKLGVKYIIRSHEPAKALTNPIIEHEGKIVTISSTRVYGGRPSILILQKEGLQKITEIERYTTYL
jgi:hypothetical protein